MSRRPPAGGPPAALSRELADFLIEFSIGLHKNAIYPPGHPLLEGATSGLAHHLDALLKERSSLSLGVARQQLIIEGVATEESNPVLRDLAQRLHRHHIGAIKFTPGITVEEVAEVLTALAVDAGRRAKPLGLEGPDVLQRWPHARLLPLTFGQLQLLEDEPDAAGGHGASAEMRTAGRSAQLWIGLARASLAEGPSNQQADSAESTDPGTVAKAIEEHKRDAAYDQVVVGYLLQIAEELKSKNDKEAVALRKRISSLVGTLQPETLARLLEMSGDHQQRRKFVSDAAQGMAAEAVVELVRAAASSSGQTISHSLVRMLSKLAVHADEGAAGARTQADGALREQVEQLIGGWQLDDPNPDGYRLALEKMSRASPMFQQGDDASPCEPERLLAMGLEIQVLGEPVWRSVDAMASRPNLTTLLGLLDEAPAGWMRDTLWRAVATVDRLHQQLRLEPVDLAVVQRLVTHMQLAAGEPLLDALEFADDRTAMALMDMLATLGPSVGEQVVSRLVGARWIVQRRLIVLLGKAGTLPTGFAARDFIRHPETAVRREALRMLIRAPETRATAIAAALADADDRTVRLALGAAMMNCPRDAALILMERASDPALSPDVRALGIRAAASFKGPQTVAFLVRRTLGKPKIFRRRSLAPKSPEMLAALNGLAAHWHDDGEAAPVLALAIASSDPEISGAVARRGGSA